MLRVELPAGRGADRWLLPGCEVGVTGEAVAVGATLGCALVAAGWPQPRTRLAADSASAQAKNRPEGKPRPATDAPNSRARPSSARATP